MALYIPDANILLNALRKDAPCHKVCRSWLQARARQGDSIGLTEVVEISLLRIGTHPKILSMPSSDVLAFWNEDLWSYKGVSRLAPGSRHSEIFSKLLSQLELSGNDVNDAWLAAIAMENQATLVSLDQGFSRFKQLSWLDPSI
ncbi:MAG: PIN domain-containing protein [Verrucomicrobia bacterium]|nr:PIN domain-containing protein [Verrucomicrobiota bacterium]MDA1066016.1 PIN domain-containing protein [Verrucomicrobiota bacterium]